VTSSADEPDVRIRRAHPAEGERLRDIAIAAKAHWGYDLAKVRQWAAQGDFSDALFLAKEVYVAELAGQVTAWASLIPRGETCWLDDLWVKPKSIRTGIGTQLFRYALNRSRKLGARWMEWEAEPNAIGFYQKMGSRYRRDSASSEWGRILQVMGVELSTEAVDFAASDLRDLLVATGVATRTGESSSIVYLVFPAGDDPLTGHLEGSVRAITAYPARTHL